jgi:hypothetical protein
MELKLHLNKLSFYCAQYEGPVAGPGAAFIQWIINILAGRKLFLSKTYSVQTGTSKGGSSLEQGERSLEQEKRNLEQGG